MLALRRGGLPLLTGSLDRSRELRRDHIWRFLRLSLVEAVLVVRVDGMKASRLDGSVQLQMRIQNLGHLDLGGSQRTLSRKVGHFARAGRCQSGEQDLGREPWEERAGVTDNDGVGEMGEHLKSSKGPYSRDKYQEMPQGIDCHSSC